MSEASKLRGVPLGEWMDDDLRDSVWDGPEGVTNAEAAKVERYVICSLSHWLSRPDRKENVYLLDKLIALQLVSVFAGWS